jgi:hypothetical protein
MPTPKFLDFRRPLIDATGYAPLMQIHGERQPANATADDRDFPTRILRQAELLSRFRAN